MIGKEVRCPYRFCGESFELKEEMLSYTKVGRICFCPKCHNKILFTIPHVPQHKEHMSKKERLRRRREIAEQNKASTSYPFEIERRDLESAISDSVHMTSKMIE